MERAGGRESWLAMEHIMSMPLLFILAFGVTSHGCLGSEIVDYSSVSFKPITENFHVRFTDEVFHPSMALKGSYEFEQFANKIRSQFDTAFGTQIDFLKIDVHSLSKGSVLANVTVMYVQWSGTELPSLQDAIEDLGFLHEMPVGHYFFYSSTMVAPPLGLVVAAVSQAQIYVTWNTITSPQQTAVVLGYSIFYRKAADDDFVWTMGAVNDYTKNDYMASDLEAFTTYIFRVAAFTNDSIGFTSNHEFTKTLEGTPSEFIHSVMCNSQSTNSVAMQWEPIDVNNWNGFMLGYVVHYKEYQSSDPFQSVNFGSTESQGLVDNLAGFKFYEMKIAAYTNAGVGPFTWVVCSTLSGVPLAFPADVSLTTHYSPVKMQVKWKAIDPASMNGQLQGYKIEYGVTRTNGLSIGFPVLMTRTVSAYTTSTNLQWFPPYSEIQVKIAAFTDVGDGPMCSPMYADTCRCPKLVYTKWYRHNTFVFNNGSGMAGAFYDYMNEMFLGICGPCIEYATLYGAGGLRYPELLYDRTRNGSFPTVPDETALIESLSTDSHLFMPIYANAELHVYQRDYRFVQLLKSQGASFIVRSQLAKVNTDTVLASIFNVWPMFVIIFLCTYLAGIVMCVTDRDINPEFSEGNFIIGSLQGFWCAFITMTTLGYGDKVPMSATARTITIMWSFVGLVLTSILIGSITTSITVIDKSAYPSLYGTKVAVLNNSVEYDLAIRRNAIANSTGKVYNTIDELFDVLVNEEVDGILVDFLIANARMDTIHERKLKLKSVIHKPAGYGIVLSAEMIALEGYVRSYVDNNPLVLPSMVHNITGGTEEDGESAIDITMTVMRLGMKYMAIAFAVAFVLGLAWYGIKLLRGRKKVDPAGYSVSTAELSDIAKDFNTDMAEKIQRLEKKHTCEIVELLRVKNFSFGFKGFATSGSFDEQKLKSKMLFSEIVSKDLR